MNVKDIQQALSAAGFDPGPIDGVRGRKTVQAIKDFQKANELIPDGIAGPQTLAKLFPSQTPAGMQLTDGDFARAAEALGCDTAAVRAVAEVESSGSGFFADGRPTILYEAHVFHRETAGKFVHQRDRHGVMLSSQSWNRSLYGATGSHQWERLEDARALDRAAADRACSWGMFQIMGNNHRACGYPTVEEFVAAMHEGAGAHLDAFVSFVKTNHLDSALRAHDWAAFALGYNGPGYADNKYDTKLAAAYARACG